MENPIEMDDLGIPSFLETPMWCSCVLEVCEKGEFFYNKSVRI